MTLTRICVTFSLGYLLWDPWFGLFGLRSLVRTVGFGLFDLGSVFRDACFGSLVWICGSGLWFGVFDLGLWVWDRWLGIFALAS